MDHNPGSIYPNLRCPRLCSVAVHAAVAALLCACTTSRPLGNSTDDATRADCLRIVTQATLHMGIALGINDARCHDDVVIDVRDGRVVEAQPTRHGCPDATQLNALIENINNANLGATFTGSCRIGDYVTPSTR